ncbi:MAG: helix-turn-helix transcriptional regulator [Pseudomonadota bacterium]|nr:helix-turn-helix transcriptional regulator [Pseudomonadota bacterium]
MTIGRDAPPSRMLLGRDRLFYGGLVGNAMKTRCLGAITLYAAVEGELEISIADGPWRRRRLIALAPYTPHRLRTSSGQIANLCLESESIDRADMAALIAEINAADNARLIRRIVEARHETARVGAGDGFSTREFDVYFLGRALKARDVDPRIRFILDKLIDALPDHAISAESCASRIGVSTSRFLHLFKESTDIPFRSARMWKRARRFMDHANRDDSLTGVALDLGYPDSSHFSHSIRACFGLQPRSIRQGSRGMKVFVGENYALSCA